MSYFVKAIRKGLPPIVLSCDDPSVGNHPTFLAYLNANLGQFGNFTTVFSPGRDGGTNPGSDFGGGPERWNTGGVPYVLVMDSSVEFLGMNTDSAGNPN